MSEPQTHATRTVRVIPTVHRWWLKDDRIGGGESDSHAVVSNGRVILIDPLPIDPAALRKLGDVEAAVLTCGNHQRAAWTLRRQMGLKVWAPENAHGLEEEPDQRYSGGDALPCGLTAFDAPGPAHVMYALWLDRPRSVVFFADQLTNEGGQLSFVEAGYQDEPARTRSSVRRILNDLPIDVLCFAHGSPILEGGREALARVLSEDHEELPSQPLY